MKNVDYNLYIENYLNNDKTKSAIMLTAPWGMGKSYYIQNSLIPHLQKDGKKNCVVVSLYGLNDVKEISKAIYLELRTKVFSEKREGFEVGKLAGKTVLKGVLSKVGVDLSLSEDDLQKLYNSIDLSDKLLIFEDLERSGISIKQVLGYVNNLVEQDGVKVLLVANENEIKKLERIEVKDKDKNVTYKWEYDADTEEYLKIKEKTVSDTILYLCDYEVAIANILKMFLDLNINTCLEEKDKNGKAVIINEILGVMSSVKDYNLRSLIFACQKTVDIFSNYNGELNLEFFKYVFLGNVAFSLKLKGKDDLKWDDKTNPSQLGLGKYPLYKFCYDFIKKQELNLQDIKEYQQDFLEKREYEKKQRETNTALSILYDFPIQKEFLLNYAVISLRDELKAGKSIPLTQYGKLANYLIVVKDVISNPEYVDECKSIMLNNLRNSTKKDDKVPDRLRIHDSFAFWEDSQREEYDLFVREMTAIFHESAFSHLETEDELEYLKIIANMMADDESSVRQGNGFLEKLDMDKLISGLEKANSEQVSDFRRGILSVYRVVNIQSILPNDKDALIQLKENVKMLIDEGRGVDKIVRLQYKWLIDNIESALEHY